MTTSTPSQRPRKQFGQSLTEVALFLPLFLVLIAGLTEIGQYLLTANRVSTASRASARFAANGGQDDGVRDVALNTVTQTLPLDEDLWDIWSIRGSINDEGTGINEDWEFNHVYGVGATENYAQVNEEMIRTMVLDELQKDRDGSEDQAIAAGTEFAGSYVSYDAESILGLNEFVGDFFTVTDFNVMRTFPFEPSTNGCSAFPIAVQEGARSLTDPDDETESENDFPDASDFSYPDEDDAPSYGDFTLHDPNLPFTEASEGDMFFIKSGGGSGNFGWLKWSEYGEASEGRLNDSLSWPGNSMDYTNTVNGNWPDELEEEYGTSKPVAGYINKADYTDSGLSIGDWVSAGPGVVNSNDNRTIMNDHVDTGRLLRVVVWSTAEGNGVNQAYHVEYFILIRLHGYRLQGGSSSWLLAEFIRIDNTCGQDE